MQNKRVSVRNIVFFGDDVAFMHRIKNQNEYYVFPGGGLEENESIEQCAVREMFEEFGIIIKPIKKLYYYEDDKVIHHYLLSNYVSGDFGSGEGEEFYRSKKFGLYIPAKHNLRSIVLMNLVPVEIKQFLINDFEILKKMDKNTSFQLKISKK